MPFESGKKLRMFDNRSLKRMGETESKEVKGDWRELHNEELQKC
jgi:hypothetical protein